MRSLVFDASTIISLAMNNLLWLLKPLRKQFQGEFYISESVKKEIIDRPLKSKRFKLEALQVRNVFEAGDLKVNSDFSMDEIGNLVNTMFKARKRAIKIMHDGEIGALVLARNVKSAALVVDERTTRMLIENPESLAGVLAKKMHTKVTVDFRKLDKFKEWLGDLKVLRSIELGIVAYELGLLDKYGDKKNALDALLWAVKLRGCSVSNYEIDEVLKLVK
tara:strand:+ start:570 stop:1229 length:660 start_codon:yes stop_codon:yes gene_type:complete